MSYFILGAGLVLQPLASRPRAAITALVFTLKTLASIAITLRVSEPLQMPPSRLLLSCLSGTAFSHLLGVLLMSVADHKRSQTLPHSRADELKPSPEPTEQPRPHRIERARSPEAMLDPSATLQVSIPPCFHPIPTHPHSPPTPPHHQSKCSGTCRSLLSPPAALSPSPVPVLQRVLQPSSSPTWLLGLLYTLLLLAHAVPLILIAMACGLLEAPAISRLFEIETHGAHRKVCAAPLQPLMLLCSLL